MPYFNEKESMRYYEKGNCFYYTTPEPNKIEAALEARGFENWCKKRSFTPSHEAIAAIISATTTRGMASQTWGPLSGCILRIKSGKTISGSIDTSK